MFVIDQKAAKPLNIMKIHHTSKKHKRRAFALSILLGLVSAEICSGAVTITPTVLFNAGTSLYNYSYSITNTEPNDLILIALDTSPSADVTAISPPIGFSLTFDPSAGVLSFFEDNDIFTNQTFASGSTVGPFTFDSPSAPGVFNYSAFDTNGNEFTGTTLSPVPEPTSSLLAGIGLTTFFLRRRRNA